jgi:hypothetical protein
MPWVFPLDNERQINLIVESHLLIFRRIYVSQEFGKSNFGASCTPCLFRMQTVEARME